MSSEPKSVPNGSKGGRPARLSDEELQTLVESMVDGQRLPTLNVIVERAGGCQRSRAVAARSKVAEKLGHLQQTDHLTS